MIITLVIFFAVLVIDLITDTRLYISGRKVNHTRGLILRVIALSPCVYFSGWLIIPAMGLSYMILFNGFYNILIGQKWEYLGTTSKLDRLQQKIPKWIKYVLLIISIFIYGYFSAMPG